MKRLFTLVLFAFILSNIISAKVPFWQSAPAQTHLLEVNAEWKNHCVLKEYTQEVTFESEAERIRFHLEAVIQLVQCATPEAGGDVQMRLGLMQQLGLYAWAESFPRNLEQPQRIPHFIDDRGVPCAVGHLMLENGFQKEAFAVHETMNLAYIREIPSEWLEQWIAYSGLTKQELALIQPGYPPALNWTDHGGNLTGVVRSMQMWNDELYVGGNFEIDGVAYSIGILEDDVIVPASFDTGGNVVDLDVYDGQLVVAGTFEGFSNFAWVAPDSFAVTYQEIGFSKGPASMCIEVDGDDLYTSTDASGIIQMHSVYHWNAGVWESLGDFDMNVWCLEVYDGQLVAGGAFTQSMSGDGDLNHLAVLGDDGWMQLGSGTESELLDLEASGDSLIAVGHAYEATDSEFKASWVWDGDDLNAHTWNLFQYPSFSDQHAMRVSKLFGTHWIIGGHFAAYPSTLTTGKSVMEGWISAGTDETTGVGEPLLTPQSGGIYDITYVGDRLFVCGDIIGSQNLVASTDAYAYLGIEQPAPLQLNVWPNPTAHTLNAELPVQGQGSYVIYATSGAEVARNLISTTSQLSIPVAGLATGTYTLVVYVEGQPYTNVFVKE